MTLYDTLAQRAREHPQRAAWSYFAKTRSYGQFLADVDAAAARLARHVRAGDRVAVALPNCPALVTLLYAVNRLGAVLVFLNPKSPVAQLRAQLALTNCRALVFTSLLTTKVKELVDYSPEGGRGLRLLVSVPATAGMNAMFRLACYKRLWSTAPFCSIRNSAEPDCARLTWRQLLDGPPADFTAAADPEADAVIFFGGGSSGRMRAVVHSSRSLNDSAARCLASEPPMTDHEVMLAMLPALHIFGFVVSVHICFAGGMRCVLVPMFHAGTCARLILSEKPSYTAGVPVNFEKILATGILQKAAEAGSLDMRPLKRAFCGGDSLPTDLRDRFNDLVRRGGGGGALCGGYGLSECCPATLDRALDAPYGCIGVPVGGIEMGIFQPGTENALPEGEQGEICICSTSNLKYAFDENGVCKDVQWPHGDGRQWLHTGDIGFAREGVFHFVARLRRLIKVSGNTILAPEVERVVEELDFVQKCYAVGLPNARRGHVVRIFVIPKGQAPKTAGQKSWRERIVSHCAGRLLPWAIPARIEFVREEDIPLTPFGKIAWSELEAWPEDKPLSGKPV